MYVRFEEKFFLLILLMLSINCETLLRLERGSNLFLLQPPTFLLQYNNFNNFSVFHLYHRKLWAKKYTTIHVLVCTIEQDQNKYSSGILDDCSWNKLLLYDYGQTRSEEENKYQQTSASGISFRWSGSWDWLICVNVCCVNIIFWLLIIILTAINWLSGDNQLSPVYYESIYNVLSRVRFVQTLTKQ